MSSMLHFHGRGQLCKEGRNTVGKDDATKYLQLYVNEHMNAMCIVSADDDVLFHSKGHGRRRRLPKKTKSYFDFGLVPDFMPLPRRI